MKTDQTAKSRNKVNVRDLIEIAKENNQQEITNSVNMNEITNKMEECSTALIDKMEQIWSKIQLSQKSEKKF